MLSENSSIRLSPSRSSSFSATSLSLPPTKVQVTLCSCG
jgi:hypothetical protein